MVQKLFYKYEISALLKRVFFIYFREQKAIFIGMMKLFSSIEMEEICTIWMKIHLFIQRLYVHPK